MTERERETLNYLPSLKQWRNKGKHKWKINMKARFVFGEHIRDNQWELVTFCFFKMLIIWMSMYCCLVAESCPTFCNPMDYSTPGFPVLHYLLDFAQTYVHWVGDAIQPSCPLSPPSLPAFSLSQHQGFFQWVIGGQSVRALPSASVLPMSIQDWFPLGLTGLILLSRGLSRVFSSTIIQKHQFFDTEPSSWSNSYIHTRLLEIIYWNNTNY